MTTKIIDILTYAAGYNFYVYDRFVGSLNDTGFSGNIYIIYKYADGVNMQKLKDKYYNVIALLDDVVCTTHINNHRFVVMKQYLHSETFFNSKYLFMCDFRDVLFQRNIEEYNFEEHDDIIGFKEGVGYYNNQCNADWATQLDLYLNENIYAQLQPLSVLCCGTTIGKTDVLRKYIDLMCDIIITHNINANLDQAIHNYILHLNKLNVNVKLMTNDDGFIYNLGCDRNYHIKENNIYYNGKLPYVVHQYDRCPTEQRQLLSNKHNFVNHL
jgi:hypothetical protein